MISTNPSPPRASASRHEVAPDPAERRAAPGPPAAPPEAGPGMPARRRRMITTRRTIGPAGGARQHRVTSTPPTRPAGRGAVRGRRTILTHALSRSGRTIAIRAAAVMPTNARQRATAASMATTGTNRPSPRIRTAATNLTIHTSPTNLPRSPGADMPRRTGRAARIRHTTRSRRSAIADQAPRTSTGMNRAGIAAVDRAPTAGPRADPRLNPGSTTPKS